MFSNYSKLLILEHKDRKGLEIYVKKCGSFKSIEKIKVDERNRKLIIIIYIIKYERHIKISKRARRSGSLVPMT